VLEPVIPRRTFVPAQLIAIRGPLAGRSFPLTDTPTVFGRNPDSTVVIASARASRRHAEIRREGAGYTLYDLGSSNGTLVGGQRVQARSLQPGDLIEIGEEAFRFDLAPDQPAAGQLGATLPVGAGMTPPVQPLPPPVQPLPPPVQQPAPHYAQGQLPPAQPLPPYGATPQPPRRSNNMLLLGILGALGACVLLAALAGGFFVLRSRGGLGAGREATPRPAQATAAAASGDTTPEPGSAPTSAAAGGEKDWTILVYIDADNDLEAYSMVDFNEMEQVGSSDRVNVVAQFDRIASDEAWDDDSNGDWTSAKRFLVTRDVDDESFGSEELEDLGEVNMGDPQTLADFIAWGVKAYPARRYAVIIGDHGSSWQGIASDDSSDGDFLSLPDLDAALKSGLGEAGIEKLDLLGFDACLMAQVDVMQTIQPYARVGLASAELEPGTGWAWEAWLTRVADDPGQDAAAVSRHAVETYIESYSEGNDGRPTLSSFDLERFSPVVEAVDGLAQAMQEDLQGSYTAIGEARSYAVAYAQPRPEEVNAIDLGDFARLLKQRDAGSAVVAAADEVGSAIEAARIAEGHAELHENSTGISIFFPQIEELYFEAYEQVSPLPVRTSWDEFLKAFYAASSSEVASGPAISDLSIGNSTVSVNDPLAIEGTVSGQNLAYVFFFAGTPNADRTGIELLSIDYVYPPGTTSSGDIPNWNDGDNPLSLTWSPMSWYMTNGSEQIPVLLGPVKYGTDSYGVEGIYTSQATGEQIDVGLLFQVNEGSAELQRIWGFPRGQDQDLQPFEIQPEPGDSFTAMIRTYTDDGTQLKPGLAEGETITFGAQPMQAFAAPAPSGNYVAGLLVRDVSGQFDYTFADITIDNAGAGQQQPQPADATPQAGAQSGTLSFRSDELRFGVDYPQAWQPNTNGSSRVVFYDPNASDNIYFGVSVYALEQPPEQANRAILDQLLEAIGKRPGYEQRTEFDSFKLSGQDALTVDFVYQSDDGELIYVGAISVTSPTTGLTYLVTIEAPEGTYNDTLPTFNAMLGSFVID
jgi:hypothetical protein